MVFSAEQKEREHFFEKAFKIAQAQGTSINLLTSQEAIEIAKAAKSIEKYIIDGKISENE